MIYIGSHISSSKGYAAMGRQALKLGADTFAFFTRNPRGGSAKEIRQEDVDKFLKIAEEGGFGKLVAHAPYTLNACATKEEVRTFAREAFADDLRRMEYIPGNYYNFHPGSHVGQGSEEGIRLISEMLNENLKKEQTTTVLLETMAGKGSEIGREFEELKRIYDGVKYPENLRVCFDTCHVSDSGLDLTEGFDTVIDKFDQALGKDQIAVFHINDSKNPVGAGKDRHENLGFGTIGFETLNYIVHHKDFENVPKILETPYIKTEDGKKSYPPYKYEIEMLRTETFDPQMKEKILEDNQK